MEHLGVLMALKQWLKRILDSLDEASILNRIKHELSAKLTEKF